MSVIADNIYKVRERIEAVASRVGRDPSSITLIAVSKARPAAMIREAYEAGQRVFGENYAQELAAKAAALSDLEIEWHFVGHLQRNKAKLITPIAHCVQTIDSIDLAEVLNKRALRKLQCLIEVNIGGEGSKYGVSSENLAALAGRIMDLPNLDLCGLMIIPPYDPDPEKSMPYFRRLKGLLAHVNNSLKLESPLRGLSMGMSHDFEAAIEEGSTIIRIGTAIFGERT